MQVSKKFKVNIPSRIENQIKCPNTRCITRPEMNEGAKSKFYFDGKKVFQCHYCDTRVSADEVDLL